MAVSFHSFLDTGTGSAALTVAITGITIPAGLNNPALVVVLSGWGSGVSTGWSATWDVPGVNQALTKVADNSNTDQECVIFALRNPAVLSSKNITISRTNAVGFTFRSFLLEGVEQSSDAAAFNNATSATGTSGNPSVTIPTAAGNLVVGSFDANANFTTVSDNTIFIDNTGSVWGVATDYAAITSGTSKTLSGAPANNHWTAVGINISAVSAGGSTLPASGGSYAISGSNAALANRAIGDPGSYALTGAAGANTVRLALGHVAGAGSYAHSGSAATFAVRDVAGAGSYALTGSAAAFVITGSATLAAASGSYALTGSPVTFLGVTPPPSTDNYTGGASRGRMIRKRRKREDEEDEQPIPVIGSTPVPAPPPFQPPQPSLMADMPMPPRTVVYSPPDDDDEEAVALLLELLS